MRMLERLRIADARVGRAGVVESVGARRRREACESNASVRLMSAPALGRPESRAASRSRNAFRDASQESTPKTAAAAMCAQSVAAPPPR